MIPLFGSPRLRWWIRVGISCGLLSLCITLIDFKELARILSGINLWLFATAASVNILGTIVVRAWIAYLATGASGLALGFGELVRINFVARFYTLTLPRGIATAVRWHHYRRGGTGHEAAALLMFETIVSLCTLFISAALIISWEGTSTGAAGRLLLPVCWVGAGISLLALLPFLNAKVELLVRNAVQSFLNESGRLAGLLNRFFDAVGRYRSISGRRVLLIVLASLCGYLLFVLSAWILAFGMAIDVEITGIAWIRSVTLLVALLPITVAGLGLREAALIALLREYGIAPSVAFGYGMASFAIQVLLGLAGAALEWSRVLRRSRSNLAARQ